MSVVMLSSAGCQPAAVIKTDEEEKSGWQPDTFNNSGWNWKVWL